MSRGHHKGLPAIWPSVLRNMSSAPGTTPERILDVWARFHGRALAGPFASPRELRDVMREDRARVGGIRDVDGREGTCAA